MSARNIVMKRTACIEYSFWKHMLEISMRQGREHKLASIDPIKTTNNFHFYRIQWSYCYSRYSTAGQYTSLKLISNFHRSERKRMNFFQYESPTIWKYHFIITLTFVWFFPSKRHCQGRQLKVLICNCPLRQSLSSPSSFRREILVYHLQWVKSGIDVLAFRAVYFECEPRYIQCYSS